LPLPGFPSPKSPSGCSGLTGRDQMVSHSFRGKAASRCAGTSQYPVLWLSHVTEAAHEAGAAAELAATREEVKYAGIVGRHMFEPIAVETLGVFNASAIQLLNDLGRRLSSISGDTRETSHLYQRVSVLVQRFNAVLLHDSLPIPDCTD